MKNKYDIVSDDGLGNESYLGAVVDYNVYENEIGTDDEIKVKRDRCPTCSHICS